MTTTALVAPVRAIFNGTEFVLENGVFIPAAQVLGLGTVPTPSTTVPLVDSGSGAVGADTTSFALADHAHPTDTSRASAAALAAIGVTGLATAEPLMDGPEEVGTSTLAARQDHVHPTDITRLAAALLGAVNGAASLDSGGHVPIAQLPAAVLGDLQFQTVWNAATNTPTLTAGVGTSGYFYIVNTAGTNSITGAPVAWNIGDWAVFDGGVWNRVAGTNLVTSVAGRLGAITLTVADISGALAAANNLSDLASPSTARTNLGLGSAAVLAAAAVLQSANNLSDLASAPTARANLGVAPGSQSVMYMAHGTYTFTIPTGISVLRLYLFSGGCGGGGGSRGATTPVIQTGGGGGASGTVLGPFDIFVAACTTKGDSQLTVTVGQGGGGGAGATANGTSGVNGSIGGTTRVVGATSGFIYATTDVALTSSAGVGGGQAAGGTAGGASVTGTFGPWAGMAGAAGGAGSLTGGAGAQGNQAAQGTTTPVSFCGSGGGGGGGLTATPTASAGGASGAATGFQGANNMVTGGAAGGNPGNAGSTLGLPAGLVSGGCGGGGGGSNASGAGGNGGAGASPGGGGGGGGAAPTGSNGGSGGAGGDGAVYIIAI